MQLSIGKNVTRKESNNKVTGKAMYTADHQLPNMLYGHLVTSTHAHAYIKHIDTAKAWQSEGVRAIVVGQQLPRAGEEIQDRPVLAYEKVRYYGEPVAVVVADTPVAAKKAAEQINVTYEALPIVHTVDDALAKDCTLVHEKLAEYKHVQQAYPEPNTNIANRTKIRKGDTESAWKASQYEVRATLTFARSDHLAMETRCAIVAIDPDGVVTVVSATQGPYMVKKLMAEYFHIPVGKIIVQTPVVGGAYGGKVSVQLELIAYLASLAVKGRAVKIVNTREEDMCSSPSRVGMQADVRLGCTPEGKFTAAEITYKFDCGAYSDKGVTISRAAAISCTGPYAIENIHCDSLCVYTNHPYVTAFRGFGHAELLLAFERAVDMLADKSGIDPFTLRRINAIHPKDTTPTNMYVNQSNIGNFNQCLERLQELLEWDEGNIVRVDEHRVRAKGISGIWKTSSIANSASSGVILTFNPDASINLISGIVEIGTGTKTVLAQILAEKMQMKIDDIHVKFDVDTQTSPEHWKTVASRGIYMAGKAVLRAADDVIWQIKDIASRVLNCTSEDLHVANGRVYLADDPTVFLQLKDVVYGYTYPNGHAIGGQIIGHGTYIMRRLTYLDQETGAGIPGPEWTVGAQGVEIEYDERECNYRVLKAVSVIDSGTVLNPKEAQGQIIGGMVMGLGIGGREILQFDENGALENGRLRTYVPYHFGEQPEYIVDFVETPHLDAPYGARGIGEHGVIGMPAALANCLSRVAGVEFDFFPLTPETVWRKVQESRGEST